jgi:hypothetical protein
MISKATIATMLGIDESNISDSIYDWAVKNFFILTGLSSEETEHEYTKFIGRSTMWLKLPSTGLKSIDAIALDGEDVGALTSDSVRFNPLTGLLNYTSGFGASQLVKVNYTTSAYTHADIHDYLVAILTLKGIATFTPQYTNQVKRIKIGRFQKDFGGVEASLSLYLQALNQEADALVTRIKGGDDNLTVGGVV